jgi:hypothetical protein
MLDPVDLGIADNGERTGHKQAAQIAVTLLADTSKPVLAPTGVLLRHDPDPGREIPPDRKAFGSAMVAARAVANTGPMPGQSSSRKLISLDRCQALIMRSNSKICSLSQRNCAPRAARHARTISGTRLSLGSATTSRSSSGGGLFEPP